MQRSLAQLVATCELPAPTGTAPIERRISESFAASRSTRRSPIAQSMTRPSPPRPGSPTLPVNGEDPFAEAVLTASVSCRLYPTDTGGTPADRCTPATGGEFPTSALIASRGAAYPATQPNGPSIRTILRALAIHRRPSANSKLGAVTTEFDTSAPRILDQLHASDVIRLDASARCILSPQHRIRIVFRSPIVPRFSG